MMVTKPWQKPHKFTKEEDKKLMKLFAAGCSYAQMMKKTGFTTTQIANRGYTCGWKYLYRHDFTKMTVEKAEYRATGEMVHANGTTPNYELGRGV